MHRTALPLALAIAAIGLLYSASRHSITVAAQDATPVSRLYLPAAQAERTPTATPHRITPVPPRPTRTPRLVTRCFDVIAQGGFEGDIDQWGSIGGNVGTHRGSDDIRPHSGELMMAMIPENNDTNLAVYRTSFGFDSPATLVSAKFTYHWAGLTDDPFAGSDSFMVGIMASNQATCGSATDCLEVVEFRQNENATPNWRSRRVDIRRRILERASQWDRWQVFFGATNDVALLTAWFVDDVQIEICKRVPEGSAATIPMAEGAAIGSPLSALDPDILLRVAD